MDENTIQNIQQRAFKIILIGVQSVGKSSILYRLIQSKFNQTYQSTIGIDFKSYPIALGNKIYSLQIWDTAGQQKFRALTSTYFKGSHGCLCVFDLHNEETLQKCDYYIQKAFQQGIMKQCVFLVGNKQDLGEGCKEAGEIFANKYGINYISVSAMSGNNINELFTNLTVKLATCIDNENVIEDKSGKKLVIQKDEEVRKRCQC